MNETKEIVENFFKCRDKNLVKDSWKKAKNDIRFFESFTDDVFELGYNIGKESNGVISSQEVEEDCNNPNNDSYDDYMERKGFASESKEINEIVKESGKKYRKRFCNFCKKETVFEKNRLFSFFNIFLLFISFGFWGIILLFHILFDRWECTECGNIKGAKVVRS